MTVTLWSLLTAVIWCDIFISLSILLTRWNRFARCNISALITLAGVCIFRLVFSYELPIAKTLRSEIVFTAISGFMEKEILNVPVFGVKARAGGLLLLIWLTVALALISGFVRRYLKISGEAYLLKGRRDFHSETILRQLINKKDEGRIRVYRSQVRVPFLHGIKNPGIYLPGCQFSDGELEGILRHEYSHYVHKDIAVKILVNCFCRLFWWNPMVYVLKRNLDHALEVKCDISTIAGMSEGERISYLNTIIRVAKNGKKPLFDISDASAGLVSAEGKRLEQRFDAVLGYNGAGWKAGLARVLFYAVMSSLLCLSFLFVLQPYSGHFTGTLSQTGDGAGNNLSKDLRFVASSENYSVTENEDGALLLYINGEFAHYLEGVPDETLKFVNKN